MQAVLEILTAISFAILIILGITAGYCWHKYNNAEDREVTEKYEKKLHQLELILYLDLLLLLILEIVYASKILKWEIRSDYRFLFVITFYIDYRKKLS